MLTFLVLADQIAVAQPTVSACAWAKAPAEDRAAFLSAYASSMQTAAAFLSGRDDQLRAGVLQCANRADIPKLWARAAIGSQAIQQGAASQIASKGGPDRNQLDKSWQEAPATPRDCVRANAAKAFGLNPTCPDPKAPLWFLQRLHISVEAQRPLAEQVLIYFNAKAQSEWADAFIAKFVAGAHGAAPN